MQASKSPFRFVHRLFLTSCVVVSSATFSVGLSHSAAADSEAFRDQVWKPLVFALSKARRLEQQIQDTALQQDPTDTPEQAEKKESEKKKRSQKAANEYNIVGGQAVYVISHSHEWPRGGLRKIPDINSDSISLDSSLYPFVPRMVAGYAYFKAGVLAADQEGKNLAYLSAANVLAETQSFSLNDTKSGGNHSADYLASYQENVFQKIVLLGKIERLRNNRSVVNESQLKQALIRLTDIWTSEATTKKSNIPVNQTRMERYVREARKDAFAEVAIVFGRTDANLPDTNAIAHFLQEVDDALLEQLTPGLSRSDLMQDSDNFRIQVSSLFPMDVIQSGSQTVLLPHVTEAKGEFQTPENDVKITLRLSSDDPRKAALTALLGKDQDSRLMPVVSIKGVDRSFGITPRVNEVIVRKNDAVISGIPIKLNVTNPSRVKTIKYELVGPTGSVTLPSAEQDYTGQDTYLIPADTVKELPVGNYALNIQCTDVSGKTKPGSTAFQILSSTGMAFLVGIDYYLPPESNLAWMSQNVTDLAEVLEKNLHYENSQIYTIKGTYDAATKKGKILISPADFKNELESDSNLKSELAEGIVTRNLLTKAAGILANRAYKAQVESLLLYYGGHGAGGYKVSDIDAFVMPNGARHPAHEWATKIFDKFGEKKLDVVGIYDACRSGKLPNQITDVSQLPGKSYYAIFACRENTTANIDVPVNETDHIGIRHSFLSDVLCQYIKGGFVTPSLTVSKLIGDLELGVQGIFDKPLQADSSKNVRTSPRYSEQHVPDFNGSKQLGQLKVFGPIR